MKNLKEREISTILAALRLWQTTIQSDGIPPQLHGVVTDLKWTNPHSWLYIDVKNDDGSLTHWAVESLSAQALVTATFQRFAGPRETTRAESLRQAQLDMIAGKHGNQFRHPFFWSPYALVGDPSR